jgi:trans-aconitate methyltransferase
MQTTAHEWNPADDARHSTGQERWARELFTLLAPKPHEGVLDIGCGDGRNTVELAALTPDGTVVGVDRSTAIIQFAQQHFPPARFPNLSFLQADASALPFHSEFDAVFSNAVLHWVLDHQPVLAGIARRLRPGGRCVLQMGEREMVPMSSAPSTVACGMPGGRARRRLRFPTVSIIPATISRGSKPQL